MRWNWQLPDWPDFRFDADRIRASEEQFLKGSGVVIGGEVVQRTDYNAGAFQELLLGRPDTIPVESEIRPVGKLPIPAHDR